MKLMRMIAMFAFITGITGCASMVHKLDTDQLSNVKKVAIFSFEIQQQEPKDERGKLAESPELKKLASDLHAEFAKELGNRTHWNVLSTQDLKMNETYAKLYQTKMTGARQVSITSWNRNDNIEVIFADGVLDQTAFRKMTFDEQAALAKSFGAQAFGEVLLIQTIKQSLSLSNFVGKEEFSYQTRANLRLFGLESKEPLWQIQNVEGELSTSSKNLSSQLTKREKLAKMANESAVSAITKLIEDYPAAVSTGER